MEFVPALNLTQNKCFDCRSSKNPLFASRSFGIFLCDQCAGTHRGMGVHISFVKGISLDTWRQEELRFMELGGHKRLSDTLKAAGIGPGKAKAQAWYASAGATAYKRTLERDVASNASPPVHAPAPDNTPGVTAESSLISPGNVEPEVPSAVINDPVRLETGETNRSTLTTPSALESGDVSNVGSTASSTTTSRTASPAMAIRVLKSGGGSIGRRRTLGAMQVSYETG